MPTPRFRLAYQTRFGGHEILVSALFGYDSVRVRPAHSTLTNEYLIGHCLRCHISSMFRSNRPT